MRIKSWISRISGALDCLMGIYYLRKKKYHTAMEYLEFSKTAGLDTFLNRLLLGYAYVVLDQLNKALSEAKHVTRKYPDKVTGWLLLVTAYVLSGESLTALDCVDKLLETKPGWKPALEAKLDCLVELKRFEEARNLAAVHGLDFDGLSETLPEKENLEYLEAGQLDVGGNTDKARDKLERFIAKNPDHAGALARLGNIYAKEGEYQRAAETLERALSLNKKDLLARSNLAYSYLQLGKYDWAAFHAKKVIRRKPGFGYPYSTLAEVYLRSPKHSKRPGIYAEVQKLKKEGAARGYPALVNIPRSH